MSKGGFLIHCPLIPALPRGEFGGPAEGGKRRKAFHREKERKTGFSPEPYEELLPGLREERENPIGLRQERKRIL